MSAALSLEETVALDSLPNGARARVVTTGATGAEERWLLAVGIGPGSVFTLLRRAPFGGPLHVRLRGGGEFAIGRPLALCMRVHKLP